MDELLGGGFGAAPTWNTPSAGNSANAIKRILADAWQHVIDATGKARDLDDAGLVELTGLLRHSTGGDQLAGWPTEMRIICRRERPGFAASGGDRTSKDTAGEPSRFSGGVALTPRPYWIFLLGYDFAEPAGNSVMDTISWLPTGPGRPPRGEAVLALDLPAVARDEIPVPPAAPVTGVAWAAAARRAG